MQKIETQDIIDAYLDYQRKGKSVSKEKLASMFPSREHEILSLLSVVDHLEDDLQSLDDRESIAFPDALLADYRINQMIGSGGTGSVFEATHIRRGKVALKLIPRVRDFRIERFQREVKIMSRLHDPNIVPIFDFGIFDRFCFISMYYVDGIDLAQLIRYLRDGSSEKPCQNLRPLAKTFSQNWKRIARLGFDVAKSLQYAHQNSILHRDIKPANILLEENTKVWVTDFGLAKPNVTGHSITQSGRTVGTIRYMAPEQINNNADERSDVYCLGLTLYELAFPHSPSLTSPVTRHPLEPLTSFYPDFPESLQHTILKACDPNPENRFQEIGEMTAALGQFCDMRKQVISSDLRGGQNLIYKLLALGLLLALFWGLFLRTPPKKNVHLKISVPPASLAEYGYELTSDASSEIKTMTTKVASGLDDAEEMALGKVDVTDHQLDLAWDGQSNMVGLRFRNLKIPTSANVKSAYIQFTCNQSGFAKTDLTIHGELNHKTSEFLPTNNNLSDRARTSSFVRWKVPVWRKGDGGLQQQTPNLAPIIAELNQQKNRMESDSITFLISGQGRRCAIAFDNLPELAPKLVVEYIEDAKF